VKTSTVASALVLSCGAVLALVACGGGAPAGSAKVASGGAKDQTKWPADDRSMCDWRAHPELEVSETAGPGALRPNVRRVYKDIGEAENRHKVLICREIDSNLDGIKDVVRTFNAKGEATKENADTNYDGKLDVWCVFVNGRMSEEQVDTNFDGAPDVWKYYVEGRLTRIKRDRNFDGKPDVWEIYTNGHLERMGLDDSFDGHVDRWDRDEAVQKEEQAAAASAADAGPSAPVPTGMPGDAKPDAGKGSK
jgi:hypothetical protein